MRIDGITAIQLSSPFPSAGIIQIRFAGVGGIFGRPLSPAKPSSPTCLDYSIFKCGIRESDTTEIIEAARIRCQPPLKSPGTAYQRSSRRFHQMLIWARAKAEGAVTVSWEADT